jgi:hypothetical protein
MSRSVSDSLTPSAFARSAPYSSSFVTFRILPFRLPKCAAGLGVGRQQVYDALNGNSGYHAGRTWLSRKGIREEATFQIFVRDPHRYNRESRRRACRRLNIPICGVCGMYFRART